MTQSSEEHQLLALLKSEICPALGCTEPIAVALAVARATEELGVLPQTIDVEVSSNIFKNGLGVGIAGTDMVGLDIAAALGAVCGKSELGLEVIRAVCDKYISVAKEYVDSDKVNITISDRPEKLFVKATLKHGDDICRVTILDTHDNICEVEKNGVILFVRSHSECAGKINSNQDHTAKLTVEQIYNFVDKVELSEISFMLDSVSMNLKLAEDGLKRTYGINVGKVIGNKEFSYIFGDGIMQYAMSLSAAASDARMSGSILPAMSNTGSGNQGISVTLPVVATAQKIGASDEKLIRALALSHLIAIHIKSYIGRLSAICGCVVAASGAACGITYLLGGDYTQTTYSIKNMIGNITGMVCDGAKAGCALKVSSGIASAVQSSVLALNNQCVSHKDGIIDKDIEQTIRNLALIGISGMEQTDKLMLDIMLNKLNN